jgi:hypothetical protein
MQVRVLSRVLGREQRRQAALARWAKYYASKNKGD